MSVSSHGASLRRLRIFLCHSSDDKPVVRKLYQQLKDFGFDPWLDEEKLLPGQDWDLEIKKAVRNSDAILICFSRDFTVKEGYGQKEIKLALDTALEKPEGTIFLIPLKLEECELPERLKHLHTVNYFDNNGFDKLLGALKHREESLRKSSTTFSPSKFQKAQDLSFKNSNSLSRNVPSKLSSTSQSWRVAPVIVSLMIIFVLLIVLVVRAEVGSSPLAASTQSPVFPLHVAAPGAECDHGWSSSYWSNRFGITNCLTTYTRITSQNATCTESGCTGVGTLEFALAARNLKLPKRYTISVVATLMVAGQKPVAGTKIGLVLQDFLPNKPYGPEYVILLYSDGSYAVAKYNCPSPQPVCKETDRLRVGSVNVTASHTFGYRYDGKTTFAEVDGVEIDMKSAMPPSSFEYVQLLVGSSDTHTIVSANFSDFRIQPD